jgi:hypothetical protein
MLGLTLSRGPFQQILGLTLPRGLVQQYSGLIVFFGHKKIAPAYDVTTNFSSFAKMEKFCPSIEYRNKFFQLSEGGKILPQYGIVLIGMSFQSLHARTSWFGPN